MSKTTQVKQYIMAALVLLKTTSENPWERQTWERRRPRLRNAADGRVFVNIARCEKRDLSGVA